VKRRNQPNHALELAAHSAGFLGVRGVAYAMYCDRTEFDAFHAARGEQCDYDTMRDEVSLYEFDGNSSFDLSMDSDTGNSSAESGWFGSFDGDGDNGLGGDGGGDGGGSD
jgi:hypothetical protein